MANREAGPFAPTPTKAATQASKASTIKADSVASTSHCEPLADLPDVKAPIAEPIIKRVTKIHIRKYT